MSNKKSADAYRDRVIALHKEGKKDSQIVRDLKISRGMVWRIMKAFKKGGHVAKPGSKKAAPKAQPKAKAEAKKPEAKPEAPKAESAKADPKAQVVDADKARAEAKLRGAKVTAKGL
jgi:transposase